MDYSQFHRDVYGAETGAFNGKPHGLIQWKGTDACIDLHCVCGSHGHIDGDFLYHYECAACHRQYALGCHVALIELTPEQAKFVSDGGGCDFQTDLDVLDDDENLPAPTGEKP